MIAAMALTWAWFGLDRLPSAMPGFKVLHWMRWWLPLLWKLKIIESHRERLQHAAWLIGSIRTLHKDASIHALKKYCHAASARVGSLKEA